MTECNHEAFSFSNCRKRQVKGNFFGEPISSNGGSLLVRGGRPADGADDGGSARASVTGASAGRFVTTWRRWCVNACTRSRWGTKI